jgi:hypothetical protein
MPCRDSLGVEEKLFCAEGQRSYFMPAPSRVREAYRLIDWAALHGRFWLGASWLVQPRLSNAGE